MYMFYYILIMLFETTMRKNHISSGIQTQFTSTIYIFVMKHFRRVLHVWIFFFTFLFFPLFSFCFCFNWWNGEHYGSPERKNRVSLFYLCAKSKSNSSHASEIWEQRTTKCDNKNAFYEEKKIPKKTSNDLFPNQDKLSISAMKFVDSNEIYICFFFKMAFCFHN